MEGVEERDNNRHESSRRKEVLAYSAGDKREMDEKERKTKKGLKSHNIRDLQYQFQFSGKWTEQKTCKMDSCHLRSFSRGSTSGQSFTSKETCKCCKLRVVIIKAGPDGRQKIIPA